MNDSVDVELETDEMSEEEFQCLERALARGVEAINAGQHRDGARFADELLRGR